MAHRFIGMNRGQHDTDVVDASSTQTKDIELNIDLSKNWTFAEVEQALEYVKTYILRKNKWPLA